MTPEGTIKAKVDRMLKPLGVWRYSPQAGIYGTSGIPDRLVLARGHLIGIEVKADKTKKPTRLQVHAMQEIERNGGRCFVIYDDATLEEARVYIYNVLGLGC
ncbi:MAG: hypothetical protein JW395_0559 [Nitrospira sp.]|nr:hypothetical protein [Nitrospira sp.]